MPAPSYDMLSAVTAAARARLLDAYSTAGEVLVDAFPATLISVNDAWRHMQEFLSKLGFQKFTNQAILSNLAAASTPDVAVLCRLDWAGYDNGGATQRDITLPSDFICPIGIDERIHGASTFRQMDDFSEKGLPLAPKEALNKSWDWRGDAIYFRGAGRATDIRLRYWSFAPDFVAFGTAAFTAQPVPILRCLDAFSSFICAEVARPRGDMDGKQFTADGEAACMILAGRENPALNLPAPQEGVQ